LYPGVFIGMLRTDIPGAKLIPNSVAMIVGALVANMR